MTTVRELLTKIGFEVDLTDLKKSEAAIDKMKGSIKELSVLAVGLGAAFAGLVKWTASFASNLSDMAEDAGLTTDALQKLSFAAAQSGVSTEDFTRSLLRFERSVGDAARTGGGPFVDSLRRIGVSIVDANDNLKPTEQLLFEVSDALSKVQNQIEKNSISNEIFGKGSVRVTNFLSKGSQSIKDFGIEAEKLNAIMDKKSILAAKNLDDSWHKLVFIANNVKNSIGSALVPATQRAIDSILDWVKANNDLLKTKITSFVESLAKVLNVLWKTVYAISSAFYGLAQILGGVENAVYLLVGAWAAFKVVTILNGIFSLIAAFTELTAGVIAFDVALVAIPLAIGGIIVGISYLILETLDYFGLTKDVLGESTNKWVQYGKIIGTLALGAIFAEWVSGLIVFNSTVAFTIAFVNSLAVSIAGLLAPLLIPAAAIGIITYGLYKLKETLASIDWGELVNEVQRAFALISQIIDKYMSEAKNKALEQIKPLMDWFMNFSVQVKSTIDSITFDGFADKLISSLKTIEQYMLGPFYSSLQLILRAFDLVTGKRQDTNQKGQEAPKNANLGVINKGIDISLDQSSIISSLAKFMISPPLALLKTIPDLTQRLAAGVHMPNSNPEQISRNSSVYNRNNNIQLHANVTVNAPQATSTLNSEQAITGAVEKALGDSIDRMLNQGLWNNTVLE